VLDLASGPSGSALAAAAAGREVIAVDASEVALVMLAKEAARRGLADRVTPVQADLRAWRPHPGGYALVLGTGYWDRDLFPDAAAAVAPGGLLAWEAFTAEARQTRPGLEPQWCLEEGEPAALLPAGYDVLTHPLTAAAPAGRRRLLARRRP
jgi:cyclopropane fatty-acyl-phospholipid synthase-like methyltransferase